MDNLHQHSSSLQWDKKLDFRTPRQRKTISGLANKQAREAQAAPQKVHRTRAHRSHQGTRQETRPSLRSQTTQDVKVRHEIETPHSRKWLVPTARVHRERQPPQSLPREMPFRWLEPNLGKAPAKKTKHVGSLALGARAKRQPINQSSPHQNHWTEHRPKKNHFAMNTSPNEKRLPTKGAKQISGPENPIERQELHGPMGWKIWCSRKETMR